jgi:hypothetical protein
MTKEQKGGRRIANVMIFKKNKKNISVSWF